MIFDISSLHWTREPERYSITDGKIEITTAPGTDLWQRTYYHFRNDNAPVLQMETDERYFSFVVKTDFTGAHHRFDQCGIVMYLDSENWLKGSVEYENGEFQHLGSVVTNHGYSDWATTAIRSRGEELIFLRKIIPGGADRSYGIEVAKLAGLPEAVVKKARTILRELESQSGKTPPLLAAPREEQVSMEAISEAECMYRWLTAQGLPPEQILLEEQADNTRENIRYSLELLEELGVDGTAEIAVVSSGYHLCRASTYMPGKMVPVAARMPARYLPLEVNYYIREAFGIAAELFF